MARLTFLGAAQTVTGSQYLLEAGGRRLLVDSGMFQGEKALRLRNWAEPEFAPAQVDAIVLTHTHLDHIGRVPRLVKQGFRGAIYCTPPTQRAGRDPAAGRRAPAAGRRRVPQPQGAHEARAGAAALRRRRTCEEALSSSAPLPLGRRAGGERRLLASATATPGTSSGAASADVTVRENGREHARPLQRRRGPLRRRADQGPRARRPRPTTW